MHYQDLLTELGCAPPRAMTGKTVAALLKDQAWRDFDSACLFPLMQLETVREIPGAELVGASGGRVTIRVSVAEGLAVINGSVEFRPDGTEMCTGLVLLTRGPGEATGRSGAEANAD
jgi:hypothetical protein